MDDGPHTDHWVYDRRLPIATLLAIAIQTITFIAVASAYVGSNEVRMRNLEAAMALAPGVSERLARVETKQDGAQDKLDRIESKLDRLVERRH
ncbi:MAG TPA: hypothetical protein VG735_08100 [Caulobacterales bacterium]|nr:hypothetical protein [Caulobacterales bacterium]